MSNFFICLLLLLNVSHHCAGIEPIGPGVGLASLAWTAYSYFFKCNSYECCVAPWTSFDLDGLKSDLQAKVFGQHIVNDVVPRVLEAHTKKDNPSKALVMSFHGCSGCGKTFVARLIAKYMFLKEFESEYVHIYHGKNYGILRNAENYKEKLREDIEKATKKCAQNLFIFDDIETMAPGVLDVLSLYIDGHEPSQVMNYGKNTFILISSTGTNKINKAAFRVQESGGDREDVTLEELEPLIIQTAFKQGGLQNSVLVEKGLIDAYVPFLPLEEKHVKLCVNAELTARGEQATLPVVDTIASKLDYFPPTNTLFSRTGCKKLSALVELYAWE